MTTFDGDFLTGTNPITGNNLDQENNANAFTDALFAPVRGAAGAVENVLDIPGYFLGYDLPENLGLGQSQTGLGGFIEGTSSFVLGFAPGVGVANALGKAGRFGRMTRLNKLTTRRQAAAVRADKGGLAKGIGFGRNVVGGAITDFAVFDGNDPRFANLVQGVPGLDNSLTDFLAADEDDDEMLGRMKNALEGAFLGPAVDGVLSILGKLKKRNKIVEKIGKTEEDEALEALEEDYNKVTEEIELESIRTAAQPVSPEEAAGMEFASRKRGPARGVTGPSTLKATREAMKLLDLDNRSTEELTGILDRAEQSGRANEPLPTNRDADPLSYIAGVKSLVTIPEADTRAFVEAVVNEFDYGKLHHKISREEMIDQTKRQVEAKTGVAANWLNEDTRYAQTLQDLATKDAEAITGIRQRVGMWNHFHNLYGKDLYELAQAVRDGKSWTDRSGVELTHDQALLTYKRGHEFFGALTAQLGRIRTEFGRGLRSHGRDIMGIPSEQMSEVLRLEGGADAIREAATKFVDDYLGDPNMAARNSMRTKGDLLWSMILDVNYASLLSGVVTDTKNLVGSLGTSFYRGLEGWVGGKVANLEATGGRKRFEDKASTAQKSLDDIKAGPKPKDLTPEQRQLRAGEVRKLRNEIKKNQAKAQEIKMTAERELAKINVLKDQTMLMARYAFQRNRKGPAPDAYAQAKRAWEKGDDILAGGGPGPMEIDKAQRDFSKANVEALTGKEFAEDSMIGAAVDKLSEAVSWPSRLMAATDQWNKQIAYSASVRADLRMQAVADGIQGDDIDRWVDLAFSRFVRDGAALTMENLRKEASQIFKSENYVDLSLREQDINNWIKDQLSDSPKNGNQPTVKGARKIAERGFEFARDNAFQKPLNPDDGILQAVGSSAQQWGQKHKWIRAHLPFIRTPVNLLTFGFDRAPIPLVNDSVLGMVQWVRSKASQIPVVGSRKPLEESANKWVQQIMSDDPRVVTEAWGRGAMTLGFMGSLLSLATAGVITGKGPADPNQRRQLEQTGWQPYSLSLGGVTLSYQGLDPLATILGIYGDWSDIMDYADDEDMEATLMGGLFGATVASLQSKSYLQGMVNILSLLSEADVSNAAGEFFGRPAASMLVPSIVAQFRDTTDTGVNQVRGFLDRVWNRVPGLGAEVLDKRRNVLGEEFTKKTYEGIPRVGEALAGWVLPISVNITSDDDVNNELARLDYPFKPPSYNRYGLDLRDHQINERQSAYDRWQELTSTTKIGGRTLRSAVRRLINSREYQALPDEADIETDTGLVQPKVQKINRLIRRYRAKAEQEMLQEFPEVQEASRNRIVQRYAFKFGRSPEVTRATIFPNDG